MTEDMKIIDESQDQKYFTITPRLVWALARNPYDYTLWGTIKGIAGEAGECYLSTEDLATLSMMSAGQVSDSRKYWMETGLLRGDFRRDPGYPQPVWHLRVPNFWAANIEWATKHAGLKDRVTFKREQLDKIREARESEKKAREVAKNAQNSLHVVKPSPGDGGVTYGDGGVTPGDAKNIHKKNQKDNLAKIAPQTTWDPAWALAAGQAPQPPTEAELQAAKLADAVNMFHSNYQDLAKAFILATGIFPLDKDVSGWSLAFKDQIARTGLSPADITAACQNMTSDKLTIKDPFSVVGTAGNLHTANSRTPVSLPASALPANDWRMQIKL